MLGLQSLPSSQLAVWPPCIQEGREGPPGRCQGRNSTSSKEIDSQTFGCLFLGGSDGKESACNAGDLGQKDPLEKGMATYSGILDWRIPWTEEPDGLQSMGSKRVGHD